MNKKYGIILIWTFFSILPLFSQMPAGNKPAESKKRIDNNQLYRFPFSLGIMYKSYTPLADYGSDFFIQDINSELHWPLPAFPSLQPVLSTGVILFDSLAKKNPDQWDHFHLYGTLGLVYSNRITKNFELGCSVAAGVSQAYFNHLLPDVKTLGTTNMLLEAGGRIGLSPSYNINIDINPALRYLYAFNPLKDFDGLMLGIGFAVHFRFGEDPDIARQIKHYLLIKPVIDSPVFASMQNYYIDHPLGKIKLFNTHKKKLTDVQVIFMQAGYMDSPTVCASIPEIKSGETLEIPLRAVFNEAVFKMEGIIPLTGEIRIRYAVQGKEGQESGVITYDLYDKRALVWDDDRKVAALITPADSSLRNYVSFIHQTGKDRDWPVLNTALQNGIQLFNALSALGCIYMPDPQLPFSQIRTQAETRAGESIQNEPVPVVLRVDTVNLPRETLKQAAGDCDDLTVLYCALLETMGVESGFITTPGHIFPAFNTKLPAREYASLHPDPQFTININGDLWIPVEITKLGQKSFLQAWERGAREWYIWESKPENRNFYITSDAQKIYRPVGLKETDLGLQYGSKQEIARLSEKDILQVSGLVYDNYEKRAASSGLKEDYNKLGIVYSQIGQYEKAEVAFRQALGKDPGYLISQINLGHLAFYQKQYQQAIDIYNQVLHLLDDDPLEQNASYNLLLMLCLSAVYYELQDHERAELYYNKALQIDPRKTEQMAYVNLSDKPAATIPRSAEFFSQKIALLFAFQDALLQ